MSELGAIGVYQHLGYPNPRSIRFADSAWAVVFLNKSLYGRGYRVAPWALDHRRQIDIPTTGVLSGTVKENAVAIPFATVCLYYRKNGELIYHTKTDVNGVFSFDVLEPGVDEYFVVAIDAPFNALIFDKVEAI